MQLMADVREHVRGEESRLFPRLRDVCPAEQLVEYGDRIRSAKAKAPTRPHPLSPSTPPGATVAGAAAALVDRVRDRLGRRR